MQNKKNKKKCRIWKGGIENEYLIKTSGEAFGMPQHTCLLQHVPLHF